MLVFRIIVLMVLALSLILYQTHLSLWQLGAFLGVPFLTISGVLAMFGLSSIVKLKRTGAEIYQHDLAMCTSSLVELGLIGTLSGVMLAIKRLASAPDISPAAFQALLPEVFYPLVFALISSLVAYTVKRVILLAAYFMVIRPQHMEGAGDEATYRI